VNAGLHRRDRRGEGDVRLVVHMNIKSNYRTMQEIVYNTIKTRIMKGDYSPGQRLITNDLANEIGVSRMPVREALQRLEAATGLVTLIPHKGAVVNAVSEDDIVEVFLMRAALEGLAARLACAHMNAAGIDDLAKINADIGDKGDKVGGERFQELNREFHSRIWKAANAPRLVTMLKLLYDASTAYRYISINLPGRAQEVVREHRAIIAALRKGDAGKAEKTVTEHYRKTLDWLLKSRRKGKPAPTKRRPKRAAVAQTA
jgi:DNA-binding GntR family transcriptional regulator